MQLVKFVRFVMVAALTVGTIAFILGGYVHEWNNVLMIVATSYAVCAVGMVPEGRILDHMPGLPTLIACLSLSDLTYLFPSF